MTLIEKLKLRLKRLNQAYDLCHLYSEDNYYYAGRIEELEYIIKKLEEKQNV